MTTELDRKRLGDAVRTYRRLSRLPQKGLAPLGGPSDETVRGIENLTGPTPSAATLAKIDQAFRWPAGAARKILDGDADVTTVIEDGVARPVLEDHTPGPTSSSDESANEGTEDLWNQEDESTSELLTKLAARYHNQESELRALREEVMKLRRHGDCPRRHEEPSAPSPA